MLYSDLQMPFNSSPTSQKPKLKIDDEMSLVYARKTR